MRLSFHKWLRLFSLSQALQTYVGAEDRWVTVAKLAKLTRERVKASAAAWSAKPHPKPCKAFQWIYSTTKKIQTGLLTISDPAFFADSLQVDAILCTKLESAKACYFEMTLMEDVFRTLRWKKSNKNRKATRIQGSYHQRISPLQDGPHVADTQLSTRRGRCHRCEEALMGRPHRFRKSFQNASRFRFSVVRALGMRLNTMLWWMGL